MYCCKCHQPIPGTITGGPSSSPCYRCEERLARQSRPGIVSSVIAGAVGGYLAVKALKGKP